MATKGSIFYILLFGLILLVAPGCNRTLQGNAGDKLSQPGDRHLGESQQSDPRRSGKPGQFGDASRPGASGHDSSGDDRHPGTRDPMPSLSEFERPNTRSLGQASREERIGGDEIITAPSVNKGGDLESSWSGGARERGPLKDVFFGFNSSAISEDGRHALLENASWLKSNPKARLVIEGHCDERGTFAYNLVLGERRAKAVRMFLVDQDIDGKRLSVVSYGKERPFCRDRDDACFLQNRRGHMVVKN